MKKKCLFLGYNSKQTKLINVIKKFDNNKWTVSHSKKKLTLSKVKKFDSIISFGYKYIITENILNSLKIPIINLHLSYLPFNRGTDPNFWSFIERTPSGVSIIEINKGIDTGKIIYQKQINLDYKNYTFRQAYKILFQEMEKLFIKNVASLLNNNFRKYKQIGRGTFHYSKDLPRLNINWNQNILSFVNNFKNEINITRRKISLHHSKLLYEWITDRKVINNSFSHNSVSYDYHYQFIKKNLKNKNMLYWIFYIYSNPFGIVRFDIKYKKATISYSISKNFRGKGLSYLMLDNALTSFIKKNNDFKILAYVRSNNKQSLKILKNTNFRINSKNRNKIEMIYEN